MGVSRVLGVLGVLTVLVAGGCSSPGTPEPAPTPTLSATNAPSLSPTPALSTAEGAVLATWVLRKPGDVSATSTRLTLAVTRVACSDGRTGKVQTPRVTYEKKRIVIRTDVEPLTEGPHTCPGNSPVSITVELAEPIGERVLVDGSCSVDAIAHDSHCRNPVRWPRT